MDLDCWLLMDQDWFCQIKWSWKVITGKPETNRKQELFRLEYLYFTMFYTGLPLIVLAHLSTGESVLALNHFAFAKTEDLI